MRLITQSISYTVKGVIFKIVRWPLLSVATLLLGIPLNGYIMRIYRGADAAPDVNNWKSLFSDGLKLMIIEIIYVIIIWIITCCILSLVVYLNPGNIAMYLGIAQHNGNWGGSWYEIMYWWWMPPILYPTTFLLFCIIVGILLPVVSIRFARSNKIIEAFNVRAVIGDICKIGWLRYLLSMILFFVVIIIPWMYFELIIFFLMIIGRGDEPLVILGIAILIRIIVVPLIAVFTARYMTLLYDSAAGMEKI